MSVYELPETAALVTSALKAAGEPSRLRILKVLEEGELCVCHLKALLGVSQPTVSRHVAALRAAGLVGERREGRWTHYRLAPASPFADRLLAALRSWGREDAIVVADRERARAFREVPVSEFCEAVRRGEG